MAVNCLPCIVGYHAECWIPSNLECCCASLIEEAPVAESVMSEDNAAVEKKERGGQLKQGKDVKDLESTGRKRAAIMYPIPKEGEPGYPLKCEWQMLAFAGGGKIPIVGCIDGIAKAIHHGPDKNTLANFVGNVHRICPRCHNRWHTVNDPLYPEVRPKGDTPFVPEDNEYLMHDGLTKVDIDTVAESEMRWATKSAQNWLVERSESQIS